jgi:SHS2 domain-containing protein
MNDHHDHLHRLRSYRAHAAAGRTVDGTLTATFLTVKSFLTGVTLDAVIWLRRVKAERCAIGTRRRASLARAMLRSTQACRGDACVWRSDADDKRAEQYTMIHCDYEELEHTAEIGLRVRAAIPAALFACAATAMFALIGAQPGEERARRAVTIESSDAESLLVDWLSDLIALHERTGEIYDQVEITRWTPTRLEAAVVGRAARTPPSTSIKAVTYHGLRLTEEAGGWLAEIYFDV